MARPKKTNIEFVKMAQEAVKRVKSKEELREAQAILLPSIAGATLAQTALLLGVSRASVHRLQVRFRERHTSAEVLRARKKWGGRRRSLLTEQAEKEFLAPWAEQANTGGILVASVIRAALAQQLGKPVDNSVVYRLLARHGWRKVAPDTHHPKSDPRAQEEWKKNSPKCWRPC